MNQTTTSRTFSADGQTYTPLAVQYNNIPEEMKALKSWVMWKPKFDPDRPGKVGKIPVPGIRGENLLTGGQAYEKYLSDPQWAGIGFVLHEEDPYVGVDLDNCVDELGQITDPVCRAVYDMVPGYTEISPGGEGVRIIAKGLLPPGRKRKGKVEMYDSLRFLTMTGMNLRVMDSPSIPGCVSGIRKVHARYLGEDPTAHHNVEGPVSKTTTILEDDEVIRLAMESAQSEKFNGLWSGKTADENGGQNGADLALCCILAFWCRRDRDQMDRLFRRSGLMRKKWDEMRGEKSYGDMTLDSAIKGTIEIFGPRGPEQIFTISDGIGHGAEELSISDVTRKYNENHAIVMLNGQHMVYRFSDNVAMKPGDFRSYHAFREVMDEESKFKTEVDLWMNCPNAARYAGGLTFDPDGIVWSGEHPPGAISGDFSSMEEINLWRGFNIQPKRGDCDRIIAHMREIICADDEEAFKWLMNWCAHFVQCPSQKPGTVPVLQSGQGTGKDTFVSVLLKIAGRHGLEITDVDQQLVGSHNQAIQDKLLIFANEALYSGSRATANKFKSFITSPTTFVNPKNINQYTVPNFARVIMATNEAHAACVDADDRRFTVFAVSERWNPSRCFAHGTEREQKRYFANLIVEIENGGTEAFMYELLRYRVDHAMVRSALETKAKRQQQRLSLSAPRQWLVEVVENGAIYEDEEMLGRRVYLLEDQETPVELSFVWKSFTAFTRSFHSSQRTGSKNRFVTEVELGNVVSRKVCPFVPVVENEGQKEKRSRRTSLVFPPLPEMRKLLAKLL